MTEDLLFLINVFRDFSSFFIKTVFLVLLLFSVIITDDSLVDGMGFGVIVNDDSISYLY